MDSKHLKFTRLMNEFGPEITTIDAWGIGVVIMVWECLRGCVLLVNLTTGL